MAMKSIMFVILMISITTNVQAKEPAKARLTEENVIMQKTCYAISIQNIKEKVRTTKNIFGEELIACSTNPMTGFYRDGCCKTGPQDLGTHTVCAIMTEEFLAFSKSKGNDLITPIPAYQFPGLKPGDKWCLCANRWMEAYHAGLAPKIILEACHEKTLEYIELEELIKFAFKGQSGN